MDEFLILLQAKLDEAKSKGNVNADIKELQSQLDKLKVQVELDPKAAQKLADNIGKLINQKIVISNIGIDANAGTKAGQEYGKQISQGISQGMKDNTSVLNSFKKSLENIGMGSKEIDAVASKISKLGVQIETLNQAQSAGKKDTLSVNIAGIDQYGQAIKLTQQYNTSTGELINTINNVSTVQQKAGVSVDNFAKKQSQAVNNLTNQINQLNRAANDPNASRPITDTSHLSSLSNAYNDIIYGIERMKNASSDSFTEEQNNVKTLISNYKSLVSEFRNAENIATQMKSTDISSGIAQAQERLGKLKANSAGFEQMSQTLRELDVAIENVGDKSSLDKFIDDLRVAESQLSRVKAETKQLSQVNKIQLLSNGGIKNDYTTQIAKLEGNFRALGLTQDQISEKMKNVTSSFDMLKTRINQPFNESNYQEIISLNDKLQKELIESSNEYTKLQSSAKGFISVQQRLSKANTIEAWNQKNSAATKQVISANEAYIASLRDLNSQMTRMQFNEIVDGFKQSENSMRGLGKLGASFRDQMSQAAESFTQWLSVSSGVMLLISKTREAVSEIKELDNILTEISKTSDMTSQQLKQLGMDAYDAASKYGRTASDYLLGVQEMARSGFYGEKGSAMAEQSLLAQSAGDMNAELANNYILATNAAYKLNGEAGKLNAILDGQNSITNRNSVAMADMATAMSEAGTVASSYRVSIEDLSAMIGTIESVTKLGGSEVGNAIKAILINLQNVTSDKIVNTLDTANASMTEFVNGAEKLRNPIDILRDLAKTFNQLDEDDPLRAEILTNIGQKYHAAKLGALLQNMEMFDKMLVDYSDGTGSALEESNKSAENLTGTLNKLSNSWTEFVNNIINSDGLKAGVNLLNKLVEGATSLTSKFGSLGTIGLGAGLFTGLKNSGGLIRLINLINNSPFLATVEFNSDVYDSYVCA